MYILLSPKGNFLSCSQIDVPVCSLGQYLCCRVLRSVWAAYSSLTEQLAGDTFKQQVMDLELESELCIKLCRLNLIITEGMLNPLILLLPKVTSFTMQLVFIRCALRNVLLLECFASLTSKYLLICYRKVFFIFDTASNHGLRYHLKVFDINRMIGRLLRKGNVISLNARVLHPIWFSSST